MPHEPVHVFHIDDDRILRRIVEQHLKLAGFEVSSHSDPLNLELTAWSKFQLLIIDLLMPGKDGLTLAEEARNAGYAGPILLLTSMGLNREQQIRLDDLEAHYMTKPFGPQHLLSRVRQLLAEAT